MNPKLKSFIIGWFKKRGWELKPIRRGSETAKARPRLAPYCTGNGIDIGPGGDPITPAAVRVDLATPYSTVGDNPVQLSGTATDLHWFRDGSLDYVYSSHVLEDFIETEQVLREWLRVLKPGGKLIIFCPDEQRFRKHCAATGQLYNDNHKHADFSLKFVKDALDRIGQSDVVYEQDGVDIYSWDLVCAKR